VTGLTVPRRAALQKSLALIRAHPRTAITIVSAVVVLALGWTWFKDSSLVSVTTVSVTGVSDGPDGAKISRALITASRSMTTLDVQTDALETAVAPYPVVKRLQVSTQFPHGMTIHVVEQVPVAAVVAAGGRGIAVTADGTLLHDVIDTSSLPAIPVSVAPGGNRVTEPSARAALAVLAAAPYALLGHIAQVTQDLRHGLAAQLSNGPVVYFGDTGDLQEKWANAEKVLADPGSAGASYIDVSDPGRPAAGSTAPPTTTTTTASGG
jgi:cell division protein FtsQ